MAVMDLYPESLKGLDLTFDETIYAIAFGLEAEIGSYGKEKVFRELEMTPEEMAVRVKYCLDEIMGKQSAYALRRVLGDLDSPAKDKEMLGAYHSLEREFGSTLSSLRSSLSSSLRFGNGVNFRNLLVKGRKSQPRRDAGEVSLGAEDTSTSKLNGTTELLYAQAQRLMDEVRLYDERRDRALEKLEWLLVEIRQRQDCPENFREGQAKAETQPIDLEGSISQIRWSYHSLRLLRELKLRTVGEVVEYFRDFENFLAARSITLLEWYVVTSILRREKALPQMTAEKTFGLDDRLNRIDFSTRTSNCLQRSEIEDFDEFIMIFADGAAEGWYQVGKIRNLGVKVYAEIVSKMGELTVDLDETICYPTTESEVRALDFEVRDRKKLLNYEIRTVGDLLAACQDENRFSGLKYIDNDLYQAALARLTEHGFVQ